MLSVLFLLQKVICCAEADKKCKLCTVPRYANVLNFMKVSEVRSDWDDNLLRHIAAVCWWHSDWQLLNDHVTLHVQSSVTTHFTTITTTVIAIIITISSKNMWQKNSLKVNAEIYTGLAKNGLFLKGSNFCIWWHSKAIHTSNCSVFCLGVRLLYVACQHI